MVMMTLNKYFSVFFNYITWDKQVICFSIPFFLLQVQWNRKHAFLKKKTTTTYIKSGFYANNFVAKQRCFDYYGQNVHPLDSQCRILRHNPFYANNIIVFSRYLAANMWMHYQKSNKIARVGAHRHEWLFARKTRKNQKVRVYFIVS